MNRKTKGGRTWGGEDQPIWEPGLARRTPIMAQEERISETWGERGSIWYSRRVRPSEGLSRGTGWLVGSWGYSWLSETEHLATTAYVVGGCWFPWGRKCQGWHSSCAMSPRARALSISSPAAASLWFHSSGWQDGCYGQCGFYNIQNRKWGGIGLKEWLSSGGIFGYYNWEKLMASSR